MRDGPYKEALKTKGTPRATAYFRGLYAEGDSPGVIKAVEA